LEEVEVFQDIFGVQHVANYNINWLALNLA
jgi:hypothetical protein